MEPTPSLTALLEKYQHTFAPVVPFRPEIDKLMRIDMTIANTALTPALINHSAAFSAYIYAYLEKYACRYAIGGYAERRNLYARSELFDDNKTTTTSAAVALPRRLHLGVDIWGAVGTEVYAFMDGKIHSFAFNNSYGDYGATLLLSHQLEGHEFYTLYGHLQLADMANLMAGQPVAKGEVIAHFGDMHENGHWPPHLHFQVIHDVGLWVGDYPGVCSDTEKDGYLRNCPDPEWILQMNRYL